MTNETDKLVISGHNPLASTHLHFSNPNYTSQFIKALAEDTAEKKSNLPKTHNVVRRAIAEQIGDNMVIRTTVMPIANMAIDHVFNQTLRQSLTDSTSHLPANPTLEQMFDEENKLVETLPGKPTFSHVLQMKKISDQIYQTNNDRPIGELRQTNHRLNMAFATAVAEKSVDVGQALEREHGMGFTATRRLPDSVVTKASEQMADNFFPGVNKQITAYLQTHDTQHPHADRQAMANYLQASRQSDNILLDMRASASFCIAAAWRGKPKISEAGTTQSQMRHHTERYQQAANAEKIAWQALLKSAAM